jgi:hypothetical protein
VRPEERKQQARGLRGRRSLEAERGSPDMRAGSSVSCFSSSETESEKGSCSSRTAALFLACMSSRRVRGGAFKVGFAADGSEFEMARWLALGDIRSARGICILKRVC